MRKLCLVTLLLLTLLLPLSSQQPVSMRNTHERVVAIVPMIGTGTDDDPRRPMFAPLMAEMVAPASARRAAVADKPTVGAKPTGRIIAYTCKPSDDGRFALVEFVATDRAALEGILKETHPDVKVFRLGEQSRKAVLTELRKFRKDFEFNLDSSKFGAIVP
jgi:hypothetical protein